MKMDGFVESAVDPYQLLKALGPLLTTEGGIKNEAQVPRIAGLMNGAKKLVSRCIYVNILRSTNNEQLLKSYVMGGGWELLNTWLQDAKESNNIPFLTDLLKALSKLPVTIDILKKNNTAKLIKQMSKTEADEGLKALAEDVVSEWMKVIKQTHENADGKPAASSNLVKKKKKKLVKKDASKPDDEKNPETDDSANPAPKKLKTENESSAKVENNHERTKKESLSKSDPHAKSKLSTQGKSPKSEKTQSKIAKEEEKAADKEEKPRVGKIKRPAHTKFRSTGLEKVSTLPPIKIKKKPPEGLPPISKGDKNVPIKREGPIFGKSLLPPEKKPKLDAPASSVPSKTLSMTSATSASTSASSASNNHGRTKLIPAKHKQVHESSNFMDALNAPAIPVRKIKMKKPQPKPTSPTTNKPVSHQDGAKGSRAKEEDSVGRVESPQETKPDPPKFCFYSSGQNDDENSVGSDKSESKDETSDADKKNSGGTGNLNLAPTKSKKCVKWKEEDQLVDVCYFEMDETERVNVNRPKDFRNAAHLEMVMEREAMKNAKLQGEGANPLVGVNDLLPWRAPVRIQVLDLPPVDYGVNSLEKGVQKQREMIVLQEIYFDKNMIPETPKEPDPEPFEPKEPTRIPLEDETKRKPGDDETADSSQGTPLYSEPMLTGNHSVHPAPHQGLTLPPGLQLDNLPPAIASLVQQIPANLPANLPGGAPASLQTGSPGQPMPGPGRPSDPPSTNATVTNVQNLLNSIMGNQGGTQPTQEELTNKLRDMLEPFKNQLPGSLGPPQPNHPGGPNYNPEAWGPRGPPGPHGPPGPGPMRGRGGMGPPFGGPGRGGYNARYNGPSFPNGPPRFPGHGGPPDMPPRGPPRPLMGGPGPWPRGGGGGRGRGAVNFAARPVCRHFMTPRGCERAQSCQFYHPGVNGPPLTQ